jgi:hypothetical protein
VQLRQVVTRSTSEALSSCHQMESAEADDVLT